MQPLKYYDNLCDMNCTAYESSALGTSGKQLFENIPDKQFEIAEIMKRRLMIRKIVIENCEAGHPQGADSRAPGDCRVGSVELRKIAKF